MRARRRCGLKVEAFGQYMTLVNGNEWWSYPRWFARTFFARYFRFGCILHDHSGPTPRLNSRTFLFGKRESFSLAKSAVVR